MQNNYDPSAQFNLYIESEDGYPFSKFPSEVERFYIEDDIKKQLNTGDVIGQFRYTKTCLNINIDLPAEFHDMVLEVASAQEWEVKYESPFLIRVAAPKGLLNGFWCHTWTIIRRTCYVIPHFDENIFIDCITHPYRNVA